MKLHDRLLNSKMIRLIINIFKRYNFIDFKKKPKLFKTTFQFLTILAKFPGLLDLFVYEYDYTTIFS